MRTMYNNDETPAVPRLALRPREAAIALGVSEKTLWSITTPNGSLPCIRVGSRVLYAPHQLRRWLNRELTRQQAAQQQGGAGSEVGQ